MEIGWMLLPSRFINEIPEESVEKNEVGTDKNDDLNLIKTIQ